ncbi:MAG: nucleoside deaminase [Bacteroidota bacterium]
MQHQEFLQKAIDLAIEGMENGIGGPFGAVIVKDGKIIGQSSNEVFKNHDPTAHAEIQAIRDACANEGTRHLKGCTLYTSCEPCPMCYTAVHYAKIERVFYAATHADADRIAGFGVEEIYKNLRKSLAHRQPPHLQLMRAEGAIPFERWNRRTDK